MDHRDELEETMYGKGWLPPARMPAPKPEKERIKDLEAKAQVLEARIDHLIGLAEKQQDHTLRLIDWVLDLRERVGALEHAKPD